MFSSENWFGASPSFYNGAVSNSLRLDGLNHTLQRTLVNSTDGSRRKNVWSFWTKFNVEGVSPNPYFYSKGEGGGVADIVYIQIASNQRVQFIGYVGDSVTHQLITTRQFRDPNAWYHIVVAVDTTQTTDTNRVCIYVNGVKETAFDTATYPSQNADLAMNWYQTGNAGSTIEMISDYRASPHEDYRLDGYLADYHSVDGLSFFSDINGTANTSFNINSFGENKNGVWIPKSYTGSHGTQGYHLKFIGTGTSQSSGAVASPTNIGDDSSGQNNHWAVNNLSSHDANIPDCPENNFATMDILSFPLTTDNIGEGNLRVGQTDQSVHASAFGIPTSGKWYWEINTVSSNGSNYYMPYAGVVNSTFFHAYQAQTGNAGDDLRNTTGLSYIRGNDTNYKNLTGTSVVSGANKSGEDTTTHEQGILGLALDSDAGTLKYYWNNSLVRTDSTLTAGDLYFPYNFGTNSGSNSWNFNYYNFGQDSSFAGTQTAQGNTDANGIGDFYYAPPSGHLALCSANLTEPPISPAQNTQAVNHFGILTYTANGNASRSIVSGASGIGGEIDFKPDWLWVKSRNAGYYHGTWDSSRTNKSALYPNAPDDEDTSTAGTIGSLDTNGFTTPNVSGGGFINIGSTTYVAWNWKANGGVATLTNDASATSVGTIDSVCQANTTAGFSIVTYTGTGSNATVAHGLEATPDMVIYKIRDTGTSWAVWHKDLTTPTTGLLELNSDGGELNSASYWHSTIPTDAVLSIGTYGGVNASSPFVAYCFASIEGYSKFGSYRGTGGSGAVDGVFVFTSFRPAFLMIKLLGAGENWHMFDSTRSTSNVIISRLIADDVTGENNNDSILDFLSNGFKFREGNAGWNGTGTYIYMAFAEVPFKYALAR